MYLIRIQHCDDQFHQPGKLLKYVDRRFVEPTFATVEEAQAAIDEHYPDLLPGSSKIIPVPTPKPEKATFKAMGNTFDASIRTDHGSRSHKGKAYVWGGRPDLTLEYEKLEACAALDGHSSIYTERGVNKEMDRLWNALNRKITSYQRKVLNVALEALGFDPKSLKINFSKTAGCRCGCSPGFIIEGIGAKRVVYIETKSSGGKND